MSASVVLVDRDPLYAWFVTEALVASGTAVTWLRDADTALAVASRMPEPLLLLVDGVTWLSAMRTGRAADADRTWPRALLVGWDPRSVPPPAGFDVHDDKPDDPGSLRALIATALASPAAAETSARTAE